MRALDATSEAAVGGGADPGWLAAPSGSRKFLQRARGQRRPGESELQDNTVGRRRCRASTPRLDLARADGGDKSTRTEARAAPKGLISHLPSERAQRLAAGRLGSLALIV
jgi:hypothetical protein